MLKFQLFCFIICCSHLYDDNIGQSLCLLPLINSHLQFFQLITIFHVPHFILYTPVYHFCEWYTTKKRQSNLTIIATTIFKQILPDTYKIMTWNANGIISKQQKHLHLLSSDWKLNCVDVTTLKDMWKNTDFILISKTGKIYS